MTRETQDSRAQTIYAIIREHTGEDFTTYELAELCGYLPGRGFSMALAAARHIALDNDECIAPAVWNPRRQAKTLRHIMAKQEHGAMRRPLLERQRDVRTRLRNIGRYGDWQSRNATSKSDRLFGSLVHELATSNERILRQLTQLADELHKG